MARSSDGGRYFSGPLEGYEGAPVLEVYAGQMMASLLQWAMFAQNDGVNLGDKHSLPNLKALASVSVAASYALLEELGYPAITSEQAQREHAAAQLQAERDAQVPGENESQGIDLGLEYE